MQLLIFLSFGIAAAVLLWTSDLLSNLQQDVLLDAMRWWVLAILPAVIGILPLKEIRENSHAWYGFLRWLKFALLWLAIIFIVVGTAYFVHTTLLPVPPDNSQTTTMNFVSEMAPRG